MLSAAMVSTYKAPAAGEVPETRKEGEYIRERQKTEKSRGSYVVTGMS